MRYFAINEIDTPKLCILILSKDNYNEHNDPPVNIYSILFSLTSISLGILRPLTIYLLL